MIGDELTQTAPDAAPESAAMSGKGSATTRRGRIQRVLLVLPALNEAGKIGATISKVPERVVDTILVIDDYSTDGTGEEAAALGAVVIRHPQNMGVGAAIRTGIYYANGRADAHILRMADHHRAE